MSKFAHKYAAIYADSDTATRALVVTRSLHPVDSGVRCYLVGPGDTELELKLEPDSNEVIRTVVRDAELGSLSGQGSAVVGGAALDSLQYTLFMSHPVLLSLALLGYGAALGATGGALVGLGVKAELFIDTVRDALGAGYWVVFVHANDAVVGQRVARTLEFTFTERRVHN